MKTLKNGPLVAWKQVEAGRVIEFLSTKPRHVKFQITANSPVEIWAASDEEMSDGVLIGASDEKVSVEYTANGTSYVLIKAEKKAAVFINAPDVDQTVSQSEKPSFTSIEPRVRNNTEFDRMFQYVKLNEQRREAELATERAALRAEMAKLGSATPVAEPVPEESTDDAEGAETTS
jgi:hypothetical protein